MQHNFPRTRLWVQASSTTTTTTKQCAPPKTLGGGYLAGQSLPAAQMGCLTTQLHRSRPQKGAGAAASGPANSPASLTEDSCHTGPRSDPPIHLEVTHSLPPGEKQPCWPSLAGTSVLRPAACSFDTPQPRVPTKASTLCGHRDSLSCKGGLLAFEVAIHSSRMLQYLAGASHLP